MISAMATKRKWRSTYDSDRRRNKTWEGMYPWVTKAPDGSENSFCRLCHAIMQPRLSWLPMRKPRNANRKSELPSQHCLFLWCEHSEWQRMSAMLSCIFTDCHMSFQVVDYLGEIIAHNGEGSPLGRIKLHHTKCSKLVTEVVAPALKEELREDIKGKKFAVLIDESTDVASHKLLCVVLRYFSEREGQILTEFWTSCKWWKQLERCSSML